MIDVAQVLLATISSAAAWFLIAGLLYLNPSVAHIYETEQGTNAVRKWKSTPAYLRYLFLGVLVRCFLAAVVFSFIGPVFPGEWYTRGFLFGFTLIALGVFPRLITMWTQTTYPNNLLIIELFNGMIGSYVIGLVIAAWM